MIVVVDTAALTTRLDEPEDVRRFHAEVHGGGGDAELLEALGGVGRPDPDGDHLWVRIDALRRLAEGRVPDGWDGDLQGMVDVAASKGWQSPDSTEIRAHVERP